MKIQFLGTGASEGIPNPFCQCQICKDARTYGGKDIRTRSSVIIDDSLQIDLSPDYMGQVLRENIDTSEIKNILFTHSHPDHLNAGELLSRMNGFAFGVDYAVNIYGNDLVFRKCFDVIGATQNNRWHLHHLIPFIETEIGDAKVTPLLANHSEKETCLVFYIEKNDKAILYGHDSGWFPPLTREWLKNKSLDLVVLECSWGFNGEKQSDIHMSIETVLATKKFLIKNCDVRESCKYIVSHISHQTGLTHTELLGIFNENNVLVAFDGLIEEI